MAAAAPGAGKDVDDDDGVVSWRMSRAELVRRWEHVFDNVGDEVAMELFTTMLLRDARAEHAQQSQKQQEEEERHVRVFEPWHPPPPGSAPPPMTAPPRVDRSVVLGLRAPPHLLPRPKQERMTTTPADPSPADLGRPANNTRGGV